MTSSTFIRDCRHALRALLHSPGFSLVATMTFALGIGVNTAVFSVFNGVLLRPLPYPEPDRITMVWMDNRRQGIKEDITSYPNYLDWRDQSTVVRAHGRVHGDGIQSHRRRGTGAPARRADHGEFLRRDGAFGR